MMFAEPDSFHSIMSLLTETTYEYLEMQVAGGCDLLMLFDSWAGALAPQDYKAHVLPHIKTLATAIKKLGKPLVYYPGANPHNVEMIDQELCDVLHLDWSISVPEFMERRSSNAPQCFQGNLDPPLYSYLKAVFVLEYGK